MIYFYYCFSQGTPTEVDSWNLFQHHFPDNNADFDAIWDRAGEVLTRPDGRDHQVLQDIFNSLMPTKCFDWANVDDQDGFDGSGLPPAPCNIRQARRDPNFYQVGKYVSLISIDFMYYSLSIYILFMNQGAFGYFCNFHFCNMGML